MHWVITVIISLMGGFIVAYATRNGLYITGDSMSYLSAAESFRAGMEFHNANGSLMTTFPPFYSVMLAYLSPSAVAALSFAATICITGVLLQNGGLRGSSYYVGIVAVAGSSMLIWLHTFVWSEVVFIPLALAALALLYRAARLRMLVAAAVLTALALLTRYAGVALLATGIIVILWTHRRKGWRAFGYALLYGVISFTPLGLWMLRNIASGNGAMGPRSPAAYGVSTAIADTLSTLISWIPYLAGITVIAGAISLMRILWRRQ